MKRRSGQILLSVCCALLALLLHACIATVREEVFPQRVTSSEIKRSPEDKTRPPQLGSVVESNQVKKDTVVIDYRPKRQPTSQTEEVPAPGPGISDEEFGTGGDPLELEYAFALDKFDKGNFDEACTEFELLSGTLPARDPLRYEALFMLAECAAVRDQLVTGVRLLESLNADAATPPAVAEKVMVRLGQLYCVLGDDAQAEQLFDLFRSTYPSSAYLPLADCSSVR